MILRLDKILSISGVASRHEVKELVKAGLVLIDGRRAKAADEKIDTDKAVIEVSGQSLEFKEHVYIMLNKPAGYISATEDIREKTVLELLEPALQKRKLFPAGRLDKDSEGLLLLTDDGAFCHNIISPRKKIAKTYFVKTEGKLSEEDSKAFEMGIVLSDGYECMPGKLKIISSENDDCALVTIYEGKFHQVKRMLASLGKPVIYLKRLSIGALELDRNLQPGEYRQLTAEEKNNIFNMSEEGKN